jgi:hypothetical protein
MTVGAVGTMPDIRTPLAGGSFSRPGDGPLIGPLGKAKLAARTWFSDGELGSTGRSVVRRTEDIVV